MAGTGKDATRPDALAFLAGGGEMGERLRALDWSKNPLGPPERWPKSLQTAVRIMLTSRQPIWVGWGEELIYLYNDPYRPIVGGKHPHCLAQPVAAVWREIWDVIEPMLSAAMKGDEGTYVESMLLIMERHGYREETYYTFSYSPIPGDDGGTGGIICANTDDTRRVVGERQLALLRELAAETANARSWREVCERSARTLESNRRDLPFATIYLFEPGARRLALAGASGIEPGHPAAPPEVEVDSAPWPLAAAIDTREVTLAEELAVPAGAALPTGAWDEPPTRAAVVPIAATGQTGRGGVLVVGLNPFRLFDDGYRNFLSLVAGQISASIASAQAYEEERRRAEALAEIDRAKTLFFTNVSHEFRTPLTLMLGPVEDILDKPDGEVLPDNRALLELVHRHGLRLLKLVNTLLDFSRIEAGRMKARFERLDVAGLTAELASMFRSAIERAGLRLVVDCPPIEAPVSVDRDLWEKIVLNLVSNAFKFTFEGEIAVGVRVDGDAAVLTVRDTGVGIPARDLPRIFERFHRVEGARGRSHEGTGIGLALVQELARLHGGSASVESEEGVGTTFTVTVPVGSAGHPDALPAEGGPDPASTSLAPSLYVDEAVQWLPEADRSGPAPGVGLLSADEPAAPRPPDGGRPRVVLADDNADMRDYVRRLLGPRYEVEAVADGGAALAAIRRLRPDLVLTDVMMPELDGFGLVAAVRADPELRQLPILMLSARAGEEARVEGVEAGADDYLVKPFSARELVARVGTHIEMARVRREAMAALRESERALREADRRKDEFLATLAHELRNPLAPISNALEIMRLAGGSAQIVDSARQTIERQLRQMVRLVDDLLDLSRITRHKTELRRERVPLATVVESALETSRPVIEAAGHELTVTLPERAIRLDVDRIRIAQVLSNLLNNAAKFTPDGGRVELTAEEDGGQAVFRVRDDGVGIPADMLGQVFEMFTQVQGGPGGAHGGLGIGLTLVQSLVGMHGGTVEAHSAGPGRGSEFVVRLPIASGEAAGSDAEAEAGATEPPAPSRRVLVVDDNRDAVQTLAMLLELMGHEVRTAYDGPRALEEARGFRPEIVLLDLGMPGMSGYDVARRIREDGIGDVVLVALTGWGQQEDRRRSHEAGFDHHLTKPADREALEALLS